MSKIYNSIGTMAGTSFDGIDVSLISTTGQDVFEVQNNLYEKFDEQIKSNLKKIKESIKSFKDIEILQEHNINVFLIGESLMKGDFFET